MNSAGAWIFGIFLLSTASGLLVLAARRHRRLDAEARCLRAMFEHAMVGMGRISRDGRWIEANPALERMLGHSPGQLVGRPWDAQCHPDDLSAHQQLHAAVLRGERDGYALEMRLLRAGGGTLFVNLAVQAPRPAARVPDSFVVVVEDITQRQLAEQQYMHQVNRSLLLLELPREAERRDEAALLQFALERIEVLTGSTVGCLLVLDEKGERIEQGADAHATPASPAGAADALSPAGAWAEAIRNRQALIANEASSAFLPGEGGVPLRRLLGVPVIDDGVVRLLAGVGNKADDYTAYDRETVQLVANETWRILRRQRSDKALRLAMQVVDASPVVCFRWAASDGWPVLFVSANVAQWGYSPEQLMRGQPDFASLVHPDDLARVTGEVLRHLDAGLGAYDQEYRLRTSDNRVIWVSDRTLVSRDAAGQVLYFDGVLTDITEHRLQQERIADTLAQQQKLNRRLEEANNQLLQSEKMASIGQLAAGIAHELNNPIGFVHSNLGTLDGYLNDLMAIIDAYDDALAGQADGASCLPSLRQLREERDFDFVRDDVFKLLAESKEGLGRMRKIVLDLKSFAHVGEQEWQEADLHQGLDSTLNIVWNELKYKCEVIKDYGDLPPVFCLISQLNQVFMNLLVNASHAIEQRGTITIRTRRVDQAQVGIEISDTGCGITADNLRRIFEPFFTTKPVGKGTGLGLSLSYSIIQRHQGRIEVDSTPGKGTTFRVILPIRPTPTPSQETPR